jgi:ribosomal protein S18 acetylase RimI-like enzyme
MENVIAVRRATTTDAAAVLACMREAFAPYKSRYTKEAYDDTVRTMAHDRVGHLRGMAVRAPWQGKGVAEKLLEAAEEALREQGCTRVTLDTTEPLARAMRFYEKHGFRRSGRISDFFGMPLHEWVKSL